MKKYALLLVVVIFTITAKGQDADKAPYAIKYDFFTPVAGCFGFSLELPRTNFTISSMVFET